MRSKPSLCPESLFSPIIATRQRIFSRGGGVLAIDSRDARVVERNTQEQVACTHSVMTRIKNSVEFTEAILGVTCGFATGLL